MTELKKATDAAQMSGVPLHPCADEVQAEIRTGHGTAKVHRRCKPSRRAIKLSLNWQAPFPGGGCD